MNIDNIKLQDNRKNFSFCPGLFGYFFIFTYLSLMSSGCSSAFLRGSAGYDAGTIGVGGVETGIGGQLEFVGYWGNEDREFGLGPSLELAGFSSEGDADPIWFTTLEARYRKPMASDKVNGPYWELGSGAGAAWSPTLNRGVLPLQAEIGIQTRAGNLIFSLGLRERALILYGDGSPPWDGFNSVQLVGGIGFGGSRN